MRRILTFAINFSNPHSSSKEVKIILEEFENQRRLQEIPF